MRRAHCLDLPQETSTGGLPAYRIVDVTDGAERTNWNFYAAVLGGAEVYNALGAAENISYISDVINEKHCATGKPEYDQPLVQSIAAFLTRERGAAGMFQVSSKSTGDLSQWRDWQTPTL